MKDIYFLKYINMYPYNKISNRRLVLSKGWLNYYGRIVRYTPGYSLLIGHIKLETIKCK